MLKKAHRLSTKEFMDVMQKGRVYTSPLFVMRVLAVPASTPGDSISGSPGRSNLLGLGAKISAVAPKKVAPTAVLRNKLRRQIYEAVYPLHKPLTPGVSVIFFAKQEMIKANFKTVRADLVTLFSKAKISV
jgi:ribonuclease P protein component